MKIKMITSVMVLAVASSVSFANVAPAPSVPSAATAPAAAKQPVKFLQFVFSAKSAEVQTVAGSEDDKLVLNNVEDSVLYFTNRPRRITNTMPTGFFIKRWVKPPPHDFKTTPPNAVLVYTNADHDQSNKVVLILKNPAYSQAEHKLSFTVQPINGGKLSLPTQLQNPTIMMAEVTMCGLLGSWGNLPGETQYDVECHEEANAPTKK